MDVEMHENETATSMEGVCVFASTRSNPALAPGLQSSNTAMLLFETNMF